VRSAFAVFLRGFTLPFGATTGRRIILDGDNGEIRIYRADGTLAVQLGGPPPLDDAVHLSSGDVDEDGPGFLTSGVSGIGATRNLFVQLTAPPFVGTSDFPFLEVRSRSQDNTTDPPEFRFDHDGPEGRIRCPAVVGEATLVAGTVAVARTSILATSRIFLSRRVAGGTLGHLTYTLTPGTGFTINSSSGTDTSTVTWLHLDE
jgi:hypothetical protein